MFGLDPRIFALLCVLFIGLGIFNIMLGRRRLQAAQAQGQSIPWYKQVSILVGIEYIVLSVMFLLNLAITYQWFPRSWSTVLAPIYLAFLFASAILAGVVIFQSMSTRRRAISASAPAPSNRSAASESADEQRAEEDMTPEERAAYQRKRRERRRKAAEARRRRAGKA